MGILSEFTHLRKALVTSLAVHFFLICIAASLPFFKRRIIYSAPLFVDIVKTPPTPAKKTQKKKSVVYKKPKKKEAKKKIQKKPKTIVKKKEETPEASEEKVVKPVPKGKVSVDAAKFPFTYYLSIIQSKITENWVPPGEDTGEKEVMLYFRILKNGEITFPKIEKTSGSKVFDQSALRAVALATPLPPLPPEFDENFLGVHFGFHFEGEG